MARTSKKDIYNEVSSHYEAWTDDNKIRMTRKFGWNEITDAYYGRLPDDWPFLSRTTDPRIRTAIIEKNARLVNGKLRGRLVPRENGDVVGARINNAILDYQWDSANFGGSMTTKIGICDIDTRLYQSKFALVHWRHVYNEEGECTFSGNELQPLDIRDCGMDYAATHIRGAKWFQYRTWEFIEDLESQTDVDGNPIYKNLGKIKYAMRNEPSTQGNNIPSQRRNEYTPRVKQLRGLEDRLGTDMAYPMLEVVHELREDKWIDFAPKYAQILREIDNPYEHGKIPVAQLRYYHLQDDALGESEVESVLPLWLAIQATVCGFMDEMILKSRPPLKIIASQVQIETIQYGPEAQWLVNSQDAVTEMQSNGEAVRYFQTSYSALISAFNSAMGMLSQGTSGVDPFNPEKTATEVRASTAQQNARDQKNQQDLIEFIKDIIMMWHANNKQFLFADPKKKEFVLKIIGTDNFNYFQKVGMDEMYMPHESAVAIGDVVTQNPNLSNSDLELLLEAGKLPKYPVVENPGEKDPEKIRVKPKLSINEMGDAADLYITPEDLDGTFDYIPDVKSMAMGADAEMAQARSEAIQLVTQNPSVLQLLSQEGFRPKVKELLIADLEDKGLRDAERFFEKIQDGQQGLNQTTDPTMGGIQPNSAVPGLPNGSQALPGVGAPEQMDQSPGGQPNGGAPIQNIPGIS